MSPSYENYAFYLKQMPPNDWKISKCLGVSLGLLLAMLGLIGLAALGFDIPGLRQIIGFLFLTFIPGILILRILKVHNIGMIDSLLYSVGLSIAFVMATGVMANFALPPLGISHPIALVPLTATFTIFFLILCFLAYMRDKNFRPANLLPKDNEENLKPGSSSPLKPVLLAILLPLLAILGASLVNSYQNNSLLLALIFIISTLVILVAFNKFIPPQIYPFMIVMMAIALLYQTTLISDYLVGTDIHVEYYLSESVVENGYWNATIPAYVNSCLSIVMLAPIYSLFLNTEIVWLFKIVYPLLFALMPLALFRIFSLQIKSQYAFLAVAFFITLPMFTMDMAQLARQQVAEFFFVLAILLMVDRKLTLIQRTTLVLIFGFGVVVSYYGLGTGYIGYLVFGSLGIIIIKSRLGQTVWQRLIGRSNSLPADLTAAGAFTKRTLAIVVGGSLILMLSYYSLVASGVGLRGINIFGNIIKTTGKQTIQGIAMPPPIEIPPATGSEKPPATGSEKPPATGSEKPPATGSEKPPTEKLPHFAQTLITRFPFLDPLTKEPLTQTALGLDFSRASPEGKIWRIFQYLVELCLIVGFFRLIFRPGTIDKLRSEYISLSVISVLILLGVFVFDTMSYGMGATRIFHITLLLMSPLFLFGGEAIGYGIIKLARLFRRSLTPYKSSPGRLAPLQLCVFAVLLPYYILNSGAVFELSRSQTIHFIDIPYSIALSSYRVDLNTVFTKQDVTGADWLSTVAQKDYPIYVDIHSGYVFYRQIGFLSRRVQLSRNMEELCSPSYIYLRTWNIREGVLTFPTIYAGRQSVDFDNLPGLVAKMQKGNRIYNNGGAQIMLLR